mgnify:CR=1 FL=1
MYMKTFRIIGIVGASALFLSASVAFAEERPMNSAQRVEVRSARAITATTTREAVKKEAQKNMETVREEAKMRIQSQKEKVTQRLADIQDKKKQQLAEKMADKFDRLNKTWTDHFLEVLSRYDEILQKMRDRASVAVKNGKDVTAADAVIQSAETAIESARTAVVAQAAKTYTLDTSTITTTAATSTENGQKEIIQGLRTAFQNLHATLFQDLFTLRDGVMRDARKAVQSALQSLSKVPNVDEETTTATTTANQ